MENVVQPELSALHGRVLLRVSPWRDDGFGLLSEHGNQLAAQLPHGWQDAQTRLNITPPRQRAGANTSLTIVTERTVELVVVLNGIGHRGNKVGVVGNFLWDDDVRRRR
jgi:hypothetical protein